MTGNWLLFASIHSYLDPSSGAALATRELLEMMAARGWNCRTLVCGVLDYAQETLLEDVLATMDRPIPRVQAPLSRGGNAEVFDFELDGVRITLTLTDHSRADRAPSPREAGMFVDVADQVLARLRPDVLPTYGGQSACLELMHRAHARGIAVVFHLHNFGYNDRRGFTDVSAIIFPSEYSRRHYRRLGLDGTVIADPISLDRLIAEDPQPQYVTFINPQPDKGMTVFVRIALELGARWPEIPILVVEGRTTADGLATLPVDLSGLTNLSGMANTPDPRHFYRVSRAVLMPWLWRESLGRVAIAAMANGIPVLASDRGARPETLGDAGFVFTIPERCTPTSSIVPSAREVAPWIAVIERLWDDPEFEAGDRLLAGAEAKRWDNERLAEQYRQFFEGVVEIAHTQAALWIAVSELKHPIDR
jgi:glycosyltransferase involved in cell wall biosynthesis